ncbi:MAG: threonine synthase [SAR202 cluster bacterium]|nr:threonine synthase [Chloroflexota bacterium]MQF95709.1 threonine synthase [SAR202 cluster bacterium]MQG33321.1 threonine synthase [SAR202 cluster bacterium]HAA95927.1 threonine synthase [Dehalococcoidia bacterium]|tara:strand:- start:2736 stop:3797 length:1062 start_codon:yes stop_codon:yes gene_type:complete
MPAGVLNSYKELLPLTNATPMITLGEGDTPLVKSNRLGRELGCPELYFKLEGCNPTGSFKDRGMVVAIAKALEEGSQAIMCASTGNTSASAAAFGAYCDLPTFVLIPKGEVAMGKLAQAMAYGAKVIMVNGNFDVALGLVREFTKKNQVTLVNSVNPHRIEGQKTAAFELVDSLGDAPDFLFIPVGNAGNITAYWKGFKEYQSLERSRTLPSMMGFQAEGAAPIVRGEPVANPQTIASAIRIGNPATWNGAVDARDESGGVIDSVSDDEILEAYRQLASKEGIFCEPASAASFAGLVKLLRQGWDLHDKTIVCVCTGNGLKDPDLAVSSAGGNTAEVEANIEAIEAATLGNGR